MSVQVTTLVNQNGPSNKKKGRSRKAHVLSATVQKATENFIIQGKQIAHDFPEVENDILAAVEEVRKTGKRWFRSAYVCHISSMCIFKCHPE